MSSLIDKKKRRELPPLFWYMEMGDWEKASERVRKHPREVKMWATLRTRSDDAISSKSTSGNSSNNNSSNSKQGTKRLALHHACFKLRSAASTAPPDKVSEDVFLQICRFLLLVIRLYPEAASQRETRHGCLPLHLAAFASCAPRSAAEEAVEHDATSSSSSAAPAWNNSTIAGAANASNSGNSNNNLNKPGVVTRRVASDATIETVQTNLSAIHAEETFTGGQSDKQMRKIHQPLTDPNVSVSMKPNMLMHPRREELAVQVINALLDAYPKGVRVDSEGGRLPLHTACAGRASPRVISTLVTVYPAAARHRNKDGFLPLHLAAHWGVSHPNVAITLLKSYPDATVGRNRWERTPLEEALCMAGENGRPYQAALVRALRKHPNYWAHPPPETFSVTAAAAVRRSVAPVDIDDSLPSSESTNHEEERQQYLRYGRELTDPEDEVDSRELWEKQTPPLSPPKSMFGRFATKKDKKEDEAMALGFSLETLIQNRRWQTVLGRLASHSEEAEKELEVMTRGGFPAQSGMTSLHYACERKPPMEVVDALIEAHPLAVLTRAMPGGALPIHVACTWHSSGDVVSSLLTADQSSAQVADELGNLALHSACFSGAEDDVIVALMAAHPKAVLSRNNQGSRPLDICKRLRHDNRRTVMALLSLKKEELMLKHKRSQSSGTWSDLGSEVTDFIELQGSLGKIENGYREGDDLQEQAVGVEVSYNDDENQELHWI